MVFSKLVILISRQRNKSRLIKFKIVHALLSISPEIRLSSYTKWNNTEPIAILHQCKTLISWCLLLGFLRLSLSLLTLAFTFSYQIKIE